MNRAVIDRTGLAAAFDITFTFVNENMPLPPQASPTASEGPSVSRALPEQLGLKFEASRGNVRFLIIDAVAHPSPD